MALRDNLDEIINPLIKNLIAKKSVTAEDLDAVLNITIEKVTHSINALAITLFMTGKDDRIHFSKVYYSKVLYEGDTELEKAFNEKKTEMEKVTLEKNKGIVGMVIRTNKSYFCQDAKSDPNFYSQIDGKTGFETKSMMTVPLKVGETVIGAIQVLNKYSNEGITFFTADDLMFLEEVASYSARIINKVNNPDSEFKEEELAYYVAQLTKHTFIDVTKDFQLDKSIMNLITPEHLKKYPIFPIKNLGGHNLKVVLENPLEYQQIESWEISTGYKAKEIAVGTKSGIRKTIDDFLTSIGEGPVSDMGDMATAVGEQFAEHDVEMVDVGESVTEESAPIIKLANNIIEDAFFKGASDIHVEPFEKELLIRFRIDGVCQEVLKLPSKSSRALTARYKIMANLNIAEKRLPQDGRIKFKNFTKKKVDIELRVSTAPLVWGEKICMRILDISGSLMGLAQMGYSEYNEKIYKDLITKPYGMILHVGPTGSGKTSTLYAAINEINEPGINIQTAEDPVEFMLRGVNQMQMKKEIGLTFSSALRCFLRQDPDVILVGEIRDLETAEIAVEAALTGHLLFSTLHTNDAATTVTRFIEMGIEPFLVSGTVLGVCAQRLLRKLCKYCKRPVAPTSDVVEKYKIPPDMQFFSAVGCEKCNNTGYKGRIGVHELLTLNDAIRDAINKKSPAEIINKIALQNGMISLFYDGMGKVKAGITSIEEVFANLMEK